MGEVAFGHPEFQWKILSRPLDQKYYKNNKINIFTLVERKYKYLKIQN